MADLLQLYPDYEYLLAQLQLILFMLGMGATLSLSDFTPVFGQPKALLYGLTFELLLTPLLAVLVVWVAGLEPGLAFGLLLVASLPGGTLSNAFTYVSRSNVALSIALSATATVLAIVTIPVVLRLLAHPVLGGGDEVDDSPLHMPVWLITREILFSLLLPLGAGMVLGRCWPRYQHRIAHGCIYLGFFLVVVMVIGAIGSARIDLGAHGWKAPLVLIAFCLLTQQCAMIAIRFGGWPTRDWVAIGIEATIRNVYLGILLAARLFPPGGNEEAALLGNQVFFVVLFYGPTSMAVAFPLAMRIRRLHRQQEATSRGEPEGDGR
jgi:BASS family bile acid:Na+ symporter